MSPTTLRLLLEIQRETRRLATLPGLPPMPLTDFCRPLRLVQRRDATHWPRPWAK